MTLGLRDVILCDRTGAIYEGRDNLNPSKQAIAQVTNREMTKVHLHKQLRVRIFSSVFQHRVFLHKI